MSDNRANVYEEDGQIIYRASGLGSCTKMLVAQRLGYRPMDTPAKAQGWFDRGNRHEVACIAVMEDQGWLLTHTGDDQSEINLKVGQFIVRGHMDGIGSHPDFGHKPYIIEAKSPKSWQMFVDELYSPNPSFLVEKYKWQISAYMLANNKEAMMVCLGDDFRLQYHGLELPPFDLGDFMDRLSDIEYQADQGLPKLCDMRSFPCPVYYLHEDEADEDDDPFDKDLDDAIAQMVYHKSQEALHRDKVVTMMGKRTKYKAMGASVTQFSRTNKTRDFKQMEKDGINVGDYTTESASQGWRITGRDVEGSQEDG